MDEIIKSLQEAVKSHFDNIVEEEIKKCQEKVRERLAKEVSGVVLNLMEIVKIHSTEREIVFRVELKKDSTK